MDTVLCLFTRARHPLLCFVSVWSLSMYSSSGVSGGEMGFGKGCRWGVMEMAVVIRACVQQWATHYLCGSLSEQRVRIRLIVVL